MLLQAPWSRKVHLSWACNGYDSSKKIDLVVSKDKFVGEVLPPPAAPSKKSFFHVSRERKAYNNRGGWIWRKRMGERAFVLTLFYAFVWPQTAWSILWTCSPVGPWHPTRYLDHLCVIVCQWYHLPLIMATYTTLLAAPVLISSYKHLSPSELS